ncbi:MAG: pilus assembly protein [Chloroflexi bacterium]|nr:pilus assembly protein [Chloroflexota bacterium]
MRLHTWIHNDQKGQSIVELALSLWALVLFAFGGILIADAYHKAAIVKRAAMEAGRIAVLMDGRGPISSEGALKEQVVIPLMLAADPTIDPGAVQVEVGGGGGGTWLSQLFQAPISVVVKYDMAVPFLTRYFGTKIHITSENRKTKTGYTFDKWQNAIWWSLDFEEK